MLTSGLQFKHSFAEPDHVFSNQSCVIGKNPPAEKSDAVARMINPALTRMHLQPHALQGFFYPKPHFRQLFLAFAKYQKIVHVPDVNPWPQLTLNHLVQRIEIDVGEEL